jgi:hypothetical protein
VISCHRWAHRIAHSMRGKVDELEAEKSSLSANAMTFRLPITLNGS